MTRGICYLMLGDFRLPLLASLFTLCRHYRGEVAVLTDRPELLARLRDVRLVPVNQPGPFPHFRLKSAVYRLSPFDSTIFLDADTLVVGDVSPLFREPEDRSILVTQYCDWTTNAPGNPGVQMAHQLREMVHYGIIHPARAEALIKANVPAINSGVFACTSKLTMGPLWERTTISLERFFIHDQLALQLLLPDFPHAVVDDRWNCHPRASKRKEGVVVWHCCQQHYGYPQTAELWFQTLREMWAENFGGVRDWWRGNPALWQGQE